MLTGKAFVVGDDVNTDEIIPARYCATTDLDSLGPHALEDLLPDKNPARLPFVPGSYAIVVGGENFGCGSSREVAPVALQKAGVKAVVAKSFARIFYRNAVNCGLPISTNTELVAGVRTGDTVTLDLESDAFWEGMDPLLRAITQGGGLTEFNKSGRRVPQTSAPPRPMTISEKILARAAGLDYVQPGMLVQAEVDTAFGHELTVPVAANQFYAAYGKDFRIWNPDKLLVVVDHTNQIPLIRDDQRSREMAEGVIRFVREQGLRHAFLPTTPYSSPGICHVLFPEQGLIRPDTLVVGTDSHTCTHGAHGALAIGIGTTDLTEVMASGRIILPVQDTILVELTGHLPHGVYPKDLILHILSQVGMNGFTNAVVEFAGPALKHLTADDRSTVANMVVEGGGTCGLFPVGELRPDPDAGYRHRLSFDLSALEPVVAPPYKPDNGLPISQVGPVEINIAWVGSCTGGKLEDVAAAAEVVEAAGLKASPKVAFYVAPATQSVMAEAGQRGYLRTLMRAGAHILQPGCGACLGMGPGATKEGDVAIFASNRNFKGRTGQGAVYLASPATVAASALTGRITDPREFLDRT